MEFKFKTKSLFMMLLLAALTVSIGGCYYHDRDDWRRRDGYYGDRYGRYGYDRDDYWRDRYSRYNRDHDHDND